MKNLLLKLIVFVFIHSFNSGVLFAEKGNHSAEKEYYFFSYGLYTNSKFVRKSLGYCPEKLGVYKLDGYEFSYSRAPVGRLNVIKNLDLRPSQSVGIGRLNLAPISNSGDDSIVPIAGAFASVLNQIFSHVGYKNATGGNIQPKIGKTVYGVVWKLKEEDFSILDKEEHAPVAYTRSQLKVVSIKDPRNFKWAEVYIATAEYISKTYFPRPVYVERVIEGARENGFPEDYINTYLKWSGPWGEN